MLHTIPKSILPLPVLCVACALALATLARAESTQASRLIDKGDEYMDKGEYDPAIAAYSEALREDPASSRACNNRGYAWSKKGQKDKAVADYSEAIRLQPRYVQALNNRGNALTELGKLDAAIADFSKALEINPLELAALLGRAFAFKAKGENQPALTDYDTAIATFQDNRNARGLSVLLAERATTWHRQREWDRAIADLDAAVRANPEHNGAFAIRGFCWRKKGEHHKALADFNEAIRLDPEFTWALNWRARAHLQLGDTARAAADFEKVVVQYTQAQARSPQDPWPPNNLSWLLATCPIERLRDGPQAVKLAVRACELSQWKSANILGTLAGAYAEVGQFDQAVDYEARAIDRNDPGYDRDAAQQRLQAYRNHQPCRDE